jgi:hypothetical protein
MAADFVNASSLETFGSMLALSSNAVNNRLHVIAWDLVEWLERCASIPMITSSNLSGGSEFTFRSDLLLTARGNA